MNGGSLTFEIGVCVAPEAVGVVHGDDCKEVSGDYSVDEQSYKCGDGQCHQYGADDISAGAFVVGYHDGLAVSDDEGSCETAVVSVGELVAIHVGCQIILAKVD